MWNKSWFQANYRFNTYQDVTAEWLKNKNIKFILSDLDSTLARHNCLHNEEEKEAFLTWYQSIEKAGTGLIVVSNNTQTHVDRFVQEYKLVGIGRCQKPRTTKIMNQLIEKGLQIETTLFMGDQLFTDIACANKLGMKSAYIQPIVDPLEKEPVHIQLKRKIERLLMKTEEQK